MIGSGFNERSDSRSFTEYLVISGINAACTTVLSGDGIMLMMRHVSLQEASSYQRLKLFLFDTDGTVG